MRTPTGLIVLVAFVAALLSPFVARATSSRTHELTRARAIHTAVHVTKSRLRAFSREDTTATPLEHIAPPVLFPAPSMPSVAAAVVVGTAPIAAWIESEAPERDLALDRSRGPPLG